MKIYYFAILLFSFYCTSCSNGFSGSQLNAMKLLSCSEKWKEDRFNNKISADCDGYIKHIDDKRLVLVDKVNKQFLKVSYSENDRWICQGSPKNDFPTACRNY